MTAHSKDWIEDCLRYHGRVLNGGKAHWCPDWDYLPIDDSCRELKACTCPGINGPQCEDEANAKRKSAAPASGGE